jgi:hypothetical protein
VPDHVSLARLEHLFARDRVLLQSETPDRRDRGLLLWSRSGCARAKLIRTSIAVNDEEKRTRSLARARRQGSFRFSCL